MPDNVELTAEEQQFFDSKAGENGDAGTAGVEPAVVEGAAPVDGQAAAEPAEAGKPAAEAAPAAQAEPSKPPAGFVPIAALQATRAELKTARDSQQTIIDRFTRIVEGMQKPAAQAAPAEKNPLEEPDVDAEKDPFAAVRQANSRIAWLSKQLGGTQQFQQNVTGAAQQQTQVRSILNSAATAERDFSAKTPDYNEASAYLIESRRGQLEDLLYTPDEIENQLGAEKIAVAARAINAGKNPAELVYALAKRAGYKTAAIDPAAGGGQVAKPAAVAIQQVAAGQRTVSPTAGAATAGTVKMVGPEEVAKMTDGEFATWHAKATQAELARVFGT